MNTITYIARDLAIVVTAYLVGSLPCSYIVGRIAGGVDIRTVGSGNMGATNVLRTVGPVPALFAFLGDSLKAVVLLLVLINCFPTVSREAVLIASVAVILGHDFSVFAGFRGGKGVAATFGVVLVLSWPVGLVEVAVWSIVMVLRQTVSLASIVSLATLPLVALLLRQPPKLALIYALLAMLGIVRHAANIRRLRAGTEPRLDMSSFRRR